MTFAQARLQARALFPQWSRRMRAKWVLARMHVSGPRVAVSSQWMHDPNGYVFTRVVK